MNAKEELKLINFFISSSKNLPVQRKQISLVGNDSYPVLKVQGAVIKGIVSSAKYLARENEDTTFLLGRDILENTLVSQWMEYRATRLDRCVDKDLSKVLTELNTNLSDKVFFVGNLMTLADVLMFYKLHSVLRSMSFHDKQNYVNLCRWFNHLQNNEDLRQGLEKISFPRIPYF